MRACTISFFVEQKLISRTFAKHRYETSFDFNFDQHLAKSWFVDFTKNKDLLTSFICFLLVCCFHWSILRCLKRWHVIQSMHILFLNLLIVDRIPNRRKGDKRPKLPISHQNHEFYSTWFCPCRSSALHKFLCFELMVCKSIGQSTHNKNCWDSNAIAS